MKISKCFAIFLITLTAIHAFICPSDNSTSYHADVSTGCRVYRQCQSSEIQILTCPEGQAFNYQTSLCQDETTFSCNETAEYHHIFKRSVELVHTISLKDTKNSFLNLGNSIRPLLIQAIKDAAPTVYDKLQSYYMPTVQAITNDILPIVREKLMPHAQKVFKYARKLSSRMIEKAFRSYELSNSTHINIVSLSDIARDVSNDIQPILKLSKYMSQRLFQNRRFKRSIDEEIHSISLEAAKNSFLHLLKSVCPLVKEAIQNAAPTVYDKIQSYYMPAIQAIRDDVFPIVREKLLPHVQKTFNYARKLSTRLLKKAYRSYELSNSTHINIVSFSDVVRDLSNDIQPVLKLSKYMSERLFKNRRPKRSIDEEVHTISLEDVNDSFLNLVKSVRPLMRQAIKDAAPTVYDKLQSYYMPTIRAIKDDVLPIVKEKLVPHFKKTFNYAKKLSTRLMEKAYRSYELSNSTHINIVSFSDVARDVSNDLQPILKLSKYMSERLFQSKRFKRSVDDEEDSEIIREKRQIPEFLSSLAEPIMRSIFAGIKETFMGTQNTLTSKVILPILFDMAENPETVFDLRTLFWSIKAAVSPLVSEILTLQDFNTPEGTVIQIPQASLDAVRNKLVRETKPIVRRIAERHLQKILLTAADNVPLIMETLQRLRVAYDIRDGALGGSILDFITKHGSLLRTSSLTHVSSYTLGEIKKDLWPIKVNLFNLLLDYYTRTPNSLLGNFFSKGFKALSSTTGSSVSDVKSHQTYSSTPYTEATLSAYKKPIFKRIKF
ncbi:uncharacterized protein LOC118192856 [Stegodyphus dumicola]|uniref:uncharacterized protein LOC118192856 n=1 Tax=Stegodyphus dumicola TaxID=202533 RepID=UPI0015AAF676|nr:uncharacterized protein LOC118192856 [Stegodyphus dumicola]